MQRFRNWLISRLLRKDKLVAVPLSWQNEYVKLIKETNIQTEAITTLINEYNQLLEDFYGKCTIEELRNILTQEQIHFKTTTPKQELIKLAYDEFKMTVAKD